MKNFILKQGKILTAIPLILLLSSCQSISLKSTNNTASTVDEASKTIVSTYSGGQVTLKDVNFELEKLVAKNEKLKGLTFDKLSQEQKEAVIKEVIIKELAFKEAKKRNLDKDKDYQEALKNFESELLKQKLIFALAKEATDEKNVKKNYDELAAKLKDKVASGVVKQGSKLPGDHPQNFLDQSYTNRQVSGDEVFYKYHGADNRTGKEVTYLTNKKYSSEEQLRQGLAIDPDWGTTIDKVTTFKPQQGTWISEGIAAPRGSYSGGDYQGVIGTKNLPKSSIIRTDKLPNGFKQ